MTPVSPPSPAEPGPAGIDWAQIWYPGPRRVFSAAEMAEFGADGPSRTLWITAAANALFAGGAVVLLAPAAVRLFQLPFGLAVLMTFVLAAWWVWWRPWRRALAEASIGASVAMVVMAVVVRETAPSQEARVWTAVVVAGGCSISIVLLWFIAVWRAQQIEGRMRERAERERAIEMARRLAAAQLEPHFLFNTLASVQHWVETGDPRAARMLAALAGYLRATLPLFRRPQLALGEELAAVRHYLDVMRLRLGERLTVEIDVPQALLGQRLPPGLLLTLVENALEHGIEPKLAGGVLRIAARLEGDAMVLDVADDGPGPGDPRPDPDRGTGLRNARERLALLHGPARAALELGPGPAGGALARVRWPHDPRTTTP
jgi:hypothetical protein